MKASLNLKSWIFLRISVFTFFLISCNSKKGELKYFLTKDSIQYFDVILIKEGNLKPITSYSFDVNGKNNRYDFSMYNDERYILPYFNEPNEYGISNNWRMLNDSTIEILGSYPMLVDSYTKDSVFLRSNKDVEPSMLLVRIKGNPRINKESLRSYDSLYKQFIYSKQFDSSIVKDSIIVN